MSDPLTLVWEGFIPVIILFRNLTRLHNSSFSISTICTSSIIGNTLNNWIISILIITVRPGSGHQQGT